MGSHQNPEGLLGQEAQELGSGGELPSNQVLRGRLGEMLQPHPLLPAPLILAVLPGRAHKAEARPQGSASQCKGGMEGGKWVQKNKVEGTV